MSDVVPPFADGAALRMAWSDFARSLSDISRQCIGMEFRTYRRGLFGRERQAPISTRIQSLLDCQLFLMRGVRVGCVLRDSVYVRLTTMDETSREEFITRVTAAGKQFESLRALGYVSDDNGTKRDWVDHLADAARGMVRQTYKVLDIGGKIVDAAREEASSRNKGKDEGGL